MLNTNPFEITGDDIASLSDSDLRELVGLLCEADYRSSDLCTSGIRYGGHQDAKDGGIDVIVDSNAIPINKSFIPKNKCGFQVKKPSMSASMIEKEMKVHGELKPKIKELIEKEGAYIIISSGSSTTETAYDKRILAMKEAVANDDKKTQLHLDFYDKDRVATWVRTYPSLILWAKRKIGCSVKAWQPYDNWSNSPAGVEDEYILDDKLRLFDGTNTKSEGISISEGLSSLRQKLSTPKVALRLAGLSGVGKTRLVQALFDDRIGDDALSPNLVFYTDMSNEPQPDPKSFMEELSAITKHAIIIVDNCSPKLHNTMTKSCLKSDNISLLTVEYDVKDDVPDETEVFKLQTASTDVIKAIIRKRYSYISQVDANAIANFSDGNARIAIALANTFKQGEALSGLRNKELFERLFWQRNNRNDDLLKAAEVCSLLYSFDGTNTNSQSELATLSSLIGMSVDNLYRYVKELKDRELIQSRGKWRAVLPHAIANRLAVRALESIPKNNIINAFQCHGRERMVKSFSRRLSYLHDSSIAQEIAAEWLSSNGWIGKSVHNLNRLGTDVLQNISPVCPDKTLLLIEKTAKDSENGDWFTSRENSNFYLFVKLLRHLAYDPKFFHRSLDLMIKFALSEEENENFNSIRNCFKSLFYIQLSGTHASKEDRSEVIKTLLKSSDKERQELGLLALNAALTTSHFMSHYEFSFGARSRDYGYLPNAEEIIPWYETFINISTNHILSDSCTKEKAKTILANNLRGLWTSAKAYNAVENSANTIWKKEHWNEGWIASNDILRYDSKGMSKDTLNRLYALRKTLKPNNLEGLARAYVLTNKHFFGELEDNGEETSTLIDEDEDVLKGEKRATERTYAIATEVVQDDAITQRLLPELLSTHSPRTHVFGEGLAAGCKDIYKLWSNIYKTALTIPTDKFKPILIRGFLSHCSKEEPEICNNILDEIVDDDLLGQWLPFFQTTAKIDKKGIKRLNRSIDNNRAHIKNFSYLAYGRSHESISDYDLANLIEKLLLKEKDYSTVIEVLTMRFHKKEYPACHSDKLLKTACKVIKECVFKGAKNGDNLRDHQLADIANVCLRENCSEEAKEICMSFKKAFLDKKIYYIFSSKLLTTLAQLQPNIFLNIFLHEDNTDDFKRLILFQSISENQENPLNQIPDEILMIWCEENPITRYPIITNYFPPYKLDQCENNMVWKDIIYSILANAPHLDLVLDNLKAYTRISGGEGPLSEILQKRLNLFIQLENHENKHIQDWAYTEYLNLRQEVSRICEEEEKMKREENESFE